MNDTLQRLLLARHTLRGIESGSGESVLPEPYRKHNAMLLNPDPDGSD